MYHFRLRHLSYDIDLQFMLHITTYSITDATFVMWKYKVKFLSSKMFYVSVSLVDSSFLT